MLRDILVRLLEQGDMTRSESSDVLEKIIDGKVNDVQIAAVLTALSVKGPTVDELTGFAETMRRSLLVSHGCFSFGCDGRLRGCAEYGIALARTQAFNCHRVRLKRGQEPLPERPEGCFAQRFLPPF